MLRVEDDALRRARCALKKTACSPPPRRTALPTGFGLKNMEQIAQRYGGTLRAFLPEQGRFELLAWLPLGQTPAAHDKKKPIPSAMSLDSPAGKRPGLFFLCWNENG